MPETRYYQISGAAGRIENFHKGIVYYIFLHNSTAYYIISYFHRSVYCSAFLMVFYEVQVAVANAGIQWNIKLLFILFHSRQLKGTGYRLQYYTINLISSNFK